MIFFAKPSQPSKTEPGKTPTPPPKPKTLFEEKKDWERRDFLRETTENPLKIGGSGLPLYERKKILNEIFPPQRFSTHISEQEVKKRLKELRSEEYRTKTWDEKKRLNRLRGYLEKETGLKGKY